MQKTDFKSIGNIESPVIQNRRSYKIGAKILIVCEGEKTEPNYFKKFPDVIVGDSIVVKECVGTATNTIFVVEEAKKLQSSAKAAGTPYDFVWVVFDRDSFQPYNFDNAIKKAQRLGFKTAWSNEAIELWFLLHFENRNVPMSREDYKDRLTFHISKKIKGFKYEKKDQKIYSILKEHGDQELAVRYAIKMINQFGNRNDFHNCNPGTTVYKLVRFLNNDKNSCTNSLIKKLKKEIK